MTTSIPLHVNLSKQILLCHIRWDFARGNREKPKKFYDGAGPAGTGPENAAYPPYFANTRLSWQNRGRPSSLTMPVSPWISGRQ